MQQTLFKIDVQPQPVNVASVPQRSPFRYPGGKTWLTPWIRRWLGNKTRQPETFIDAFAGGGSVSLTVACENLCRRVIMVELDEDVASVWRVVLSPNADSLAQRIVDFELNTGSATKVIEDKPRTDLDRAFQTIVRNRVYHGGILASGSGFLKHGENGKGILSRWYPETLARRIREISSVRHKILFIQGDAFEIVQAYSARSTAVTFLDPPYTVGGKKAGTRLYKFFQVDHRRLFEIASTIQGEFLMTYDVSDEVAELALVHGLDIEKVPMTNTHHSRMEELLIGRDLAWAR